MGQANSSQPAAAGDSNSDSSSLFGQQSRQFGSVLHSDSENSYTTSRPMAADIASQDSKPNSQSASPQHSSIPSTRTRRISRHLSSLGLLQSQSHPVQNTTALSATTVERASSSLFAPFSHSNSEDTNADVPLFDCEQTERPISTSTPRIFGPSASSAVSRPGSSSVLRRRAHELLPVDTDRRSTTTNFFRNRLSRVRSTLGNVASYSTPFNFSAPEIVASDPARTSQDAVGNEPEPSTARSNDASLLPEPAYLRRRPRPSTAMTTATATGSGFTLPLLPTTVPPPTPLDPPNRSSVRPHLNIRPRSHRNTNTNEVADMLSSSGTARQRPNEDQAAMLSRLLSVAAAATAASLIGNSSSNIFSQGSSHRRRRSRAAPVADADAQVADGNHTDDNNNQDDPDSTEAIDGSFESFLRALQNGRLAAALRNESAPSDTNPDSQTTEDGLSPLNFFRMFRFQTDNDNHNNSNSGGGENNGQRMVPVIIVGIRSVNSRPGAAAGPAGGLDETTATMLSIQPTSTDLSRSTGLAAGRRRRRSEDSLDVLEGASSSRQRRSSTMLFDDDILLDEDDEEEDENENDDSSDEDYTEDEAGADILETPGRRHTAGVDNQSDAEDNSRLHLNGRNTEDESGNVGEPSTTSTANGVRSWIIYVLGGQYPENHPILTTPSLFTDSPTYEDMMLLSSYIGPAKPPVATQEDVDKSGGVQIAAQELNGERCLVCLSDFELGDECRKLQTCGHTFHRGCIDEWLTTGRNTCPLCRAEGVKETNERTGVAPNSLPTSSLAI
ncbi:hypothetical protein V1512DRAFT_262879 [Lipomyces arxii]|uniref:uncharacterized protein n=1 Tax=Lipomyces arxii TaxID=56418 RepID=UPI0034CD0C83